MKLSKIFRLLIIILAPALGFIIGYQFSSQVLSSFVFEFNLVSEKTAYSEYLRPKSWSRAAQGNLEFYADWPKEIEQPRAKMMISDNSSPMIDILGDMAIEDWRDEAFESSPARIKMLQAYDSTCQNFSNTQYIKGTNTRGDISDLVTVTAECKKGDIEYKYYWRTTVDDKQIIRVIAFTAEKWIWEKNEKIFVKMIDSVQPISSAEKI